MHHHGRIEHAAGGLIASAALHQAMKHLDKLPRALQPPALTADPGEFLVGKAEDVLGRRLPEPAHALAASAMHLGYGTTLSLLATAVPAFRVRSLRDVAVKGAALGVGAWAISYVVALPATKLAPPPTRQGLLPTLNAVATHVLWGMGALLPVYALERR